MKAVEDGLDRAQYLAIAIMAGSGVVAELPSGELVKVVLAVVVIPYHAIGTVTQKIVRAVVVGGPHVRLFVKRVRLNDVLTDVRQVSRDAGERVAGFFVNHPLDASRRVFHSLE